MIRLANLIFIAFCILVLSSCGTPLAPKATKQEQEQFKQKILNMLEQEYSQPFKVLDFDYSYETHYPKGNCSDCRVLKYGTYTFKIQAIDNPVIVMSFIITDNKNIKGFEEFKSHYIKTKYCVALSQLFLQKRQNKVNQINLEKAKQYCDKKGQNYYKDWE